ncbi:MAG TPA: hypothetical protein DHW82_12740 [Spirochaetia bacterium]|nr:MAG: hypothetical protein A2Y41_03205 [Spirochaetes bacterium GWB1_36_13]HCL57857.1 hypothetical protein [Spirochaetia bacterium]
MKQLLLSLLLILSADLAFSNSLVIKNIIVSGNEKTKETVIQTIIRTRPGDPFTEETIYRIKRYLENQRKFSEVAVSYKIENEKEVSLFIYVKDKWSIIGAPYYSYRDSGSSYGFIFLESNLFGYQNIFLLSMIYEYKHLNGTLLYSHPRVLGSLFSYVLKGIRNYQPVKDYEKDTVVSSFFKDEIGGSATAKYQFYGEHYLMLAFHHYQYQNDFDSYREKGFSEYFQVYLELDWTHYQNFFGQGTYLGLYYDHDLFSEKNPRHLFGFKLEQFFNPYQLHNVYFNFNAFHTLKIKNSFEQRIGQDGTDYAAPLRGYEKGQLKAKTAMTSTIEYRLPLFELFSTDFLAVPFFDASFSSPDSKKFHLDYSTGIAFRFYLKEVLIPAVEVFAGYGIPYKNLAIGIMIGTRM